VELRGVLPAGVTIVRLCERSGASRAERDRSLPTPPAASPGDLEPAIVVPTELVLDDRKSRFDPREELAAPARRVSRLKTVALGDWAFPSPRINGGGPDHEWEDHKVRVGFPSVILDDNYHAKHDTDVSRSSTGIRFTRELTPALFDETLRVWSATAQWQCRLDWKVGEAVLERSTESADARRGSAYGPPGTRRVQTVELIDFINQRSSNCDGPPPEEE
jgi:hypothetical protein